MTARAKRLRQIEKALFPEVLPVKVAQLCDAVMQNDADSVDEVLVWTAELTPTERSEFCKEFVIGRPICYWVFRLWSDGELNFLGWQTALESLAKYEKHKGQSFAVIRADGSTGINFDRLEKSVGRIIARHRKKAETL